MDEEKIVAIMSNKELIFCGGGDLALTMEKSLALTMEFALTLRDSLVSG